MNPKIEIFLKPFLKKELPDVRPGDTIRVFQKYKEADKEKTYVFEGVVIGRKHRKEIGATITVRKVIGGVGVERIFPIHSPTIAKIEVLKRGKVRKAKLYYLRKVKGKKARLKRKELVEAIAKEEPKELEEKKEMEELGEVKESKEIEEKNE